MSYEFKITATWFSPDSWQHGPKLHHWAWLFGNSSSFMNPQRKKSGGLMSMSLGARFSHMHDDHDSDQKSHMAQRCCGESPMVAVCGMVPFCINHCLFKLGATNSCIKLWQHWHSGWYAHIQYEDVFALKLSCSVEMRRKMMDNVW
jgi:hypothetical protein